MIIHANIYVLPNLFLQLIYSVTVCDASHVKVC